MIAQAHIPERDAAMRALMQQLVVALTFFHQIGVDRRDIKMRNTWLTQPPSEHC